MRLVLDTSVVVAALGSTNGASRLWLDSLLQRQHTLLVSVPLVLEYEAVLLRPKQRERIGLNEDEVCVILDALCAIAEPVELSYLWRSQLRDPDDEMVLETAALGRADTLLTFNIRDFVGAERVGILVEQPGPAWRRAKGI